jgi:xanthine dehydrogenase YagS FAD-binding subunit
MKVEGGIIRDVRLALGGVAHKPWRASVAEQLLRGGPPIQENFIKAAAAELAPAIPRNGNAFKIELGKRTIVLALSELLARGDARGGAQ